MTREQFFKAVRQYAEMSARLKTSFAPQVIHCAQAYAASLPPGDPQRLAKVREIASHVQHTYSFTEADIRQFPDNFNMVDQFAVFEPAGEPPAVG